MSVSNVRAALIQAFTNGAFFAQENIAFENMAFTPGALPWAKITFSPIQPVVATLGQGGTDDQSGYLQIDLNYPQGTGEADIMAKADAIRNAFPAGSSCAYSGQVVTVANCGRSQGRISNGYYRISVTINFYARIPRSS